MTTAIRIASASLHKDRRLQQSKMLPQWRSTVAGKWLADDVATTCTLKRLVLLDATASGQSTEERCCTSLIMSPSAFVRNVRYTVTSRRAPVEEDSYEHEGTSARRSVGTALVDRCAKDTGVELPTNDETPEAVSTGRSEGSAAPQCGTRFEAREALKSSGGGFRS